MPSMSRQPKIVQHRIKNAPQHGNLPGPTSRESVTCRRCKKIPWERLTQPNGGVFLIEDSEAELRSSPCRVCRLLADLMQPALQLQSPFLVGGSSTVWGKLNGKVGFGVKNLTNPRFTGPTLGVAQQASEQEHLDVRKLYPGALDIGLVNSWIQNCKREHCVQCTPERSDCLEQLKVLDCHRRIIVNAPSNCQYVALSYIWGSTSSASYETDAGKALPNSTDNGAFMFRLLGYRSLWGMASNALGEDFSRKVLPKTIEDSIIVTKLIGFRYIWIDRYCIDQSDGNDKHDQIQQMGSIYAAAQLTLIASAGENPSYGLPGVSCPRSQDFEPRVEYLDSIALVRYPPPGTSEIYASKWASRAWTFQEGYFSKRRLFFTDRQIIYVCNQAIHGETDEVDSPNCRKHPGKISYLIPSMNKVQTTASEFNLAMGYMEEFSKRDLSYDSDALNAIIGALNTLRYTACPIYQISGVPFERTGIRGLGAKHPSIALLWYYDDPCRRRTGFPSWSSLGWAGQLHHHISQPTVSHGCSVHLWKLSDFQPSAQGAWVSLEECRAQHYYHSEMIRISAPRMTPRFVFRKWTTAQKRRWPGLEDGFHVRLEIDVHITAYSKPSWDAEPEFDPNKARLLGIIFGNFRTNGSMEESTSPRRVPASILILQREGRFYKRLGIIFYDTTSRFPTSRGTVFEVRNRRLLGGYEGLDTDDRLISPRWWLTVKRSYDFNFVLV